MSRFCKFGKLHVTKGNVDKLLGILLTASKELKRSLAPTGNFPFVRKIAKPAEPVNGQDERRISCAAVDSHARLC